MALINIPTLEDLIYKAYEEDEAKQPPRTHLGASEIGKKCHRQIWFNFRWAYKTPFEGRMLRLFETGKEEEERVYRNLRRIGLQVHEVDQNGKQFSFSKYGGHFAGSCDGVILGHPDAPKTWHLTEIKTHSLKSFEWLIKNGLKKAKPEHWAQMQIYMTELGLERGLYIAICKNDDRIYTERIEIIKKEGKALSEKALAIIESPKAPKKIGQSHDSCFDCTYCSVASACHRLPNNTLMPSLNCRTCIHSTPRTNEGDWYCEKHARSLSKEEQQLGCEEHLFIPDLVPADLISATDDEITYQVEDRTITNKKGKGLSL